MPMKLQVGPLKAFVCALLVLSGVSTGFFLLASWRNHNLADWYLVWNLCLAWLPLVVVYGLVRLLRRREWSSWPGISLSLLWLAFLPNSFYMVSDFIHLQDVRRVDVLYDSVMFTMFILTGLMLGYTSLYIVHAQLLKRIRPLGAWLWVGGVLFLCSFAIYLGRDLRWNTWDILVNPGGILFDVSDRIIHPLAHPQAYTTTLIFFVFLTSLYGAVWSLVRALHTRQPVQSKE